jgi:lipopolysaccharide heptosyltransferase I
MIVMDRPMHRILILRLSAVGDTILSMPIACALRRALPSVSIGWVVASGASTLLEGHDCIDDLFVLDKKDQQSMGAYLRFLHRVRAWRPDVVIDAQGLTKSSWIGWCSGASTRIGHQPSEFEGRELSRWLNNRRVEPQSQHVVQRGLELLRPLGIDTTEVEYRVPSFPIESATVERQRQELDLGNAWATINVGAGWPSKLWPAERYAEVAKHLHHRWNLKSLIAWGGNQEWEFAKQLAGLAPNATVLAPKTSLRELTEWIRRTVLFIGSDTGPMHLAVALDIPTVGIIGPMPVERVGPWGSKHASVQNERLPLTAVHERKTNCGPMLSIQASSVTNACDRVLNNTPPCVTRCVA